MGQRKKNILIISVYYPPIISIASFRLASFAKYLDKDLFNITVLTIDNPKDRGNIDKEDGIQVFRMSNSGLVKLAGFEKTKTYFGHKIRALYNKVLLSILVEVYTGWKKNTIKTALKLNKKNKFDLILSSFSPASSHLVALKLKHKIPGVKWIADFRDEMSSNPELGWRQQRYYRKIEKQILSNAVAITTVTPYLVSYFHDQTVNLPTVVKEIRNGYDFEISRQEYVKNDVFTITHAGTFYSGIKPYTFLQSVENMLKSGKINDVRIRLIGAGHGIKIPGYLRDKVILMAKIPHEETIAYLAKSDAFLLVLPEYRQHALPGKLYEYIALGKPVIALMDKNKDAANLLTESGTGLIADENSIPEIEKAIEQAYYIWKNNITLKYRPEVAGKHHRKVQAGLLQNLILDLLN